MQHCYVTEQCDQSPSFFWIPTPETAPAVVCPNSTQNNSGSQKRNTNLHGPVNRKSDGFQAIAVFIFIFKVENQTNITQSESQEKSRIADRNCQNVNQQPKIISQNRLQRMKTGI